VNHRPAVGAIAEWSGHVAYVESVSASGITITDDNYSNDRTTRQQIAWGSSHWPSHFLHLADRGPRWPADIRGSIVSSRTILGFISRWLVDSNGHRHFIPDRSTYRCLKRNGAKDYGLQPRSILDRLHESEKKVASCHRRSKRGRRG
jgi:hypothetical protein